MPTIPIAPSVGPQQGGIAPAGLASGGTAAAADLLGEVSLIAFAARAAESAALRETQFARAESEIIRSSNQRLQEAEDLEDVDTIRETSLGAFTKDVQGVLDNTPDEAVRTELERVSQKRLVTFEFNATNTQRRRQKDASIAAIPGTLDTFRDSIAINEASGNDVAAQEDVDAMELFIGANPHLTEVQKADMIALERRRIDLTRVDAALEDNPALLQAITSDAEAFAVKYPDLVPGDRSTIRKAAETELKRLETASTKARRDFERDSAIEMLDRIYNEENPAGFPTMLDVAGSTLTPEFKEKFFKLIIDEASGKDVNREDHALRRQVCSSSRDRRRPQVERDRCQGTDGRRHYQSPPDARELLVVHSDPPPLACNEP